MRSMTTSNKSRVLRNSALPFRCRDAPAPALRPAAAQDQVQVLAVWSCFGNRILCYNTAVVFDINIQVFIRNHAVSQLQDFREPI